MSINYWHRFAYMFQMDELEMPEIVKFWMIATYAGVIQDDKSLLIGVNVLDNSLLNEALLLGLIRAFPDDEPITYRQLAEIIGKHPNTVGSAMKRMFEKGYLSKSEPTVHGAYYTIEDDSHLPKWMIEFAQALVDIETDEDFKKKVYEDCQGLGFKRGFQVLRKEIVAKFTPARKPKPGKDRD